MKLKDNLNYLRESKGITTYKITKETKISKTTIQQLFDGTTKDPRISVLLKLSSYLNMSVEDLMLKDLSKDERDE